MSTSTVTTTTYLEPVVHEVKVERQYDVTVVVDVSGSMAGGKLEAAKEGVRQLFNEVLVGQHDRMSVWIFGDQAEKILPMTNRKKVDIEDVLRRIKVPANARTSLFDAVDSAMDEMKASQLGGVPHDLQLVVLTDGEDTTSTRVSLEALAQRLEKPSLPEFHFVAIAVGDEAKKNLTPLCKPKHCRLIQVDDGAAGIKKAFGDCVKTIKEIRMRERTVVKKQQAVTVDGRTHTVETSELIEKVLPAGGGGGGGGGSGAAPASSHHRSPQRAIDDGRSSRSPVPAAAHAGHADHLSRSSSRSSSRAYSPARSIGGRSDASEEAELQTKKCSKCNTAFLTKVKSDNVMCKKCSPPQRKNKK